MFRFMKHFQKNVHFSELYLFQKNLPDDVLNKFEFGVPVILGYGAASLVNDARRFETAWVCLVDICGWKVFEVLAGVDIPL